MIILFLKIQKMKGMQFSKKEMQRDWREPKLILFKRLAVICHIDYEIKFSKFEIVTGERFDKISILFRKK